MNKRTWWSHSVLALALVGSGSLGSAGSRAADWLQFRGTQGDGESRVAGLPTEWSSTENVAWRCELPGEGWSSPVVLGERIYLSYATLKDQDQADGDRELGLLIVDARSGKLLKRAALFSVPGTKASQVHSKNGNASPTPVIDGQRVYVHFGHLGTACTTLGGELVWRNDKLSYPPVHGNGGSPVVVGRALIFSQDGADDSKVIALDTQTGKVRWETPRNVESSKKFSFCTPLVLEVAGKQQVIIPGSNVVQSLDPETGKEFWRVRYDGYSVIPRPIVADGLVMVCTGYDRPSLLAIRPDGSGDVTDTHVAWKFDGAVPHTPSLSARDGLLFMVSDNGIASCLEAATGKEVWKERIGGNFSASPLLAGDVLYLLSEEGDATVVKAEPEFSRIARNHLGERTLASMAVVDHDLLIRSAAALYRIAK